MDTHADAAAVHRLVTLMVVRGAAFITVAGVICLGQYVFQIKPTREAAEQQRMNMERQVQHAQYLRSMDMDQIRATNLGQRLELNSEVWVSYYGIEMTTNKIHWYIGRPGFGEDWYQPAFPYGDPTWLFTDINLEKTMGLPVRVRVIRAAPHEVRYVVEQLDRAE